MIYLEYIFRILTKYNINDKPLVVNVVYKMDIFAIMKQGDLKTGGFFSISPF